jgi:hypothetical protein
MNSATAFRFLILMIPVAWVIVRLFPDEHPRYGNQAGRASNLKRAKTGMKVS